MYSYTMYTMYIYVRMDGCVFVYRLKSTIDDGIFALSENRVTQQLRGGCHAID